MPERMAFAASPLPDVQFDIGNFIAPAFTLFVPAKLTHNPTRGDQAPLAAALSAVEAALPFSPSGVLTFVA